MPSTTLQIEELMVDHVKHLDHEVICDCDEAIFFPLLRKLLNMPEGRQLDA